MTHLQKNQHFISQPIYLDTQAECKSSSLSRVREVMSSTHTHDSIIHSLVTRANQRRPFPHLLSASQSRRWRVRFLPDSFWKGGQIYIPCLDASRCLFGIPGTLPASAILCRGSGPRWQPCLWMNRRSRYIPGVKSIRQTAVQWGSVKENSAVVWRENKRPRFVFRRLFRCKDHHV